jgi:hypothetical protein
VTLVFWCGRLNEEPFIKRKKRMKNEKKQPVSEVRYGTIVAAIWEQRSGKGVYYNVTLSRIYKDGGKWKRSESFGRDDLLTVAKVATEAHTRIFAHAAVANEE